MAEDTASSSSQKWTSTQAYIMAVICLLIGGAVGYLVRGSTGGASTPAPAATGAEQAMPPAGMGQGQRPTPEQMKGMADKAAAPLLEQLKSKPNDPELLAHIGNMYYDAQVLPVAIDYYQKSLAADPKNSNVRTDMATAMSYMGNEDQAIEKFNQALKDNPKNSNALLNRGIVKWQGKMDVPGALADWEQLLKQDPNFPQADKVKMLVEQV